MRSIFVEDPLQIGPSFFKTKPICEKGETNVSFFCTEAYERIAGFGRQRSKAKQSQFEKAGTKAAKGLVKNL
jgi:hypothetical protein